MLKEFLAKSLSLNSDIRLSFRHSSSVKTCARQIKAYFGFAFTLKRPNKVPRWDINEGCVLRHILKVNTPFSVDVLVFDVKSRTHSIMKDEKEQYKALWFLQIEKVSKSIKSKGWWCWIHCHCFFETGVTHNYHWKMAVKTLLNFPKGLFRTLPSIMS